MSFSSAPLGAILTNGGVRFSLWAPSATGVELVLPGRRIEPRELSMNRGDDGVWSLHVPGVRAGQTYGYRVDGPWDPAAGMRFNRNKVVLDPYARSITGGVDFRGDIFAHRLDAPHLPDTNDSLGSVPLGVVVEDTPPPVPVAKRRSMADSIIYETHLRGFTKLHPEVPDHLRGSYLGLADPAVIDYLTSLGVTAVELLPVHHFVSEPFVAHKGLRNYWGYNTLGFFAPHALYKAHLDGDQIAQFKEMVSALHEAGIEVLLDVVYNHTAEGGVDGPTLSWRGIDQRAYYRLDDAQGSDYDVTGCGNSMNTDHPMVRRMIVDSLRYWVQEMGVDGFRFDLASTLMRDGLHHVVADHELLRQIEEDETFEDIKLIAEPWDVGPFGYQLGSFGSWSEWNDRFRDNVRDYWRGQCSGVGDLATRLAGSADVFDSGGRGPETSVNYVTAHDGFTMRDLVSYDVKHNQANGESNRDGTDNNRSWNHGVEGETSDPGINALRRRQVLNLMATQLLAVGTPMILAGDEFGRTQAGNNNAYCQDTPISWVNWEITEEWEAVRAKIASLIALRNARPVLRPFSYRYHDEVTDPMGNRLERIDLTWLGEDGDLMQPDAWQDPGRRLIGMYTSTRREGFVIWFNSGAEDVETVLPSLIGGRSFKVVWTSADELDETVLPAQADMTVPARSVVVLEAEVAHTASQLDTWRTESENGSS